MAGSFRYLQLERKRGEVIKTSSIVRLEDGNEVWSGVTLRRLVSAIGEEVGDWSVVNGDVITIKEVL
jgi:hypothetical protein